jgi:hypothetical protein
VTPFWEKLRGDPDYDVKVSPDGTVVQVALKRVISLDALRKSLYEGPPFSGDPIPAPRMRAAVKP